MTAPPVIPDDQWLPDVSEAPDLAPDEVDVDFVVDGVHAVPDQADHPLPTAPLSDEERQEAHRLEEQRREDELRAGFRLRERARRAALADVDQEEALQSARWPDEHDSLADELELPRRERTYRIESVFPTGGNTILTAQFKTGKTTMVNHVVHCLADGVPFLDRYSVRPVSGRVGVFNYEVDEDQYRDWLRDVGVRNTRQVSLLHLRGYRLSLLIRHHEDRVVDWLKRHEIEVWILDPYARALAGVDENDNSGVGRFLDTLDVIKSRAGVQELLMPAHTGRAELAPGEERARGAARIDDWPDARWLLTREKDTDRRFLKCTGRDVEEPEQALAYDPETRALRSVGGSRATTRRLGLEEELLAFIGANPGLGTNELADAFPNKRNDITAALRALEATSRIHIETGVNRKRLHYLPGGTAAGQSGFVTQPLPWVVSDPSVGIP